MAKRPRATSRTPNTVVRRKLDNSQRARWDRVREKWVLRDRHGREIRDKRGNRIYRSTLSGYANSAQLGRIAIKTHVPKNIGSRGH